MQHVRGQNQLISDATGVIAEGDGTGHRDMEKKRMPRRKLPRKIVLWAPAIAIALVLAIWALGAIDFLTAQ